MRCVFVVRVILLRVGSKSFAKTLQVRREGVGPGGSAGRTGWRHLLCRLASGGEICRKVGLHRRKWRREGPLINNGFGGVQHSKGRCPVVPPPCQAKKSSDGGDLFSRPCSDRATSPGARTSDARFTNTLSRTWGPTSYFMDPLLIGCETCRVGPTGLGLR
jgi:hypothetical protein